MADEEETEHMQEKKTQIGDLTQGEEEVKNQSNCIMCDQSLSSIAVVSLSPSLPLQEQIIIMYIICM